MNYGPWTNDCIQYLKDIPNLTLLKGNHENYFINGEYDGTHVVAQTFFQHCYANFDSSLINEIQKYGEQTQLDDYTIQHTINKQYIFADTDISQEAVHLTRAKTVHEAAVNALTQANKSTEFILKLIEARQGS